MTPLRARDGLYADVERTPDGGLVIRGQDLHTFGDNEYEYTLTVRPEDVPTLVAALGGQPKDDVVELLVAHSEDIFRQGESTWLDSIGVRAKFWSRLGD
jgi:hypothetical protein